MHYVKAKGILSAKNGINLYRGCTHGCIYCDSRSKCYQINHEFTDIEIKENAIELLEVELSKKRKSIMISTGSMTDPYLHVEENVMYTRKMLELVYKYNHGVSLLTKSDLILRDLDLLIKINNKTKVIVEMTLTTFDEELCKIIEPNVCTTKRRFEVLKILNSHNIETIVWICPLLPFINDTIDNLKGILNYCKEANVKKIITFGTGLTLREGNREYFYKNLDKYFSGLKEKYIKYYKENYIVTSFNSKELIAYFQKFCKENEINYNTSEIFNYISTALDLKRYEKISLF